VGVLPVRAAHAISLAFREKRGRFATGEKAHGRFDHRRHPSYEAGTAAAAFNTQPWTPRSFFDGPRVQAPDLVVFGVGKTYDFFA
jgi:hypothetical protein